MGALAQQINPGAALFIQKQGEEKLPQKEFLPRDHH